MWPDVEWEWEREEEEAIVWPGQARLELASGTRRQSQIGVEAGADNAAAPAAATTS